MKNIVSVQQMREAERRAVHMLRTSEETLMERAAEGIVSELVNRVGAFGRTVAFACGPGNNGGDGFAAARLYAEAGGQSIVIIAEAAASALAAKNLRRAEARPNVYIASLQRLADMPKPDAWVDALFGTGLSRPIEDKFFPLLSRMEADREAGSLVLAVDIPSGLQGDTGKALGRAVIADVTVTFEWAKLGHYYNDGLDACGELVTWPIGIDGFLEPGSAQLMERTDLRSLYRRRTRNSHKGTYGHLLIVAGSCGMAGAALFSARSALRSGAGLVTVACPKSILPVLQAGAPGAMCVPLNEEDGAISGGALNALDAAIINKTALAVGPGLSRRASKRALFSLLNAPCPAVVDADALNLVAESSELQALLREDHILTPHPGEAARLTGRDASSLEDLLRGLKRFGATVVLKGSASTICAGESQVLSAFGSSGMAKGGSGDVLTGLLGGLLAQGYSPADAAKLGCCMHGLAGERAARKYSAAYMGPDELIESIGALSLELEANHVRD